MLLGSGKSGAKIILTGEHAVVYNVGAIAIPFNGLETVVNIYKSNDEITIDSKFHTGYLKDGSHIILGIEKLVNKILDEFKVEKRGIHIEIISNIKSQRGLGSSAAVSVAVVRALYDAFNKELTDIDLIEQSMFAEKIHHTNPSGLDVYTLIYQKPIWFERDKGFKRLNINLDANLLIIDTNMMSQTKRSVELVKTLTLNNPKLTNEVFNNIKNITKNVKKALKTNDINLLNKEMAKNQKELEKLNVSNDTINSTILKAKSIGLKGLKLTGGGMGGCVIAVEDNKDVIKKALKEFDNIWVYNLGDLKNDS